MKVLDVQIGQSVDLPGIGKILIKKKSGNRVRLAFDMPQEQKICLEPVDASLVMSLAAES